MNATNTPAALVDAHHHLWNPVGNEPDNGYVWLKDIGAPKPFGDPTSIQRDYLLDEFTSEPHLSTLTASVHLQCDGAIADPVAETRFIQSISEKNGFPIAIVGFVNLALESAEAVINSHLQSRNFRGVRQILSRLEDRPDLCFAPVHFIQDKAWQENFCLLAEHDLSFDLQCYPEQMADVAEFLALHSAVPVIIDHGGSPWDQSLAGKERWLEGMRLLAQLPQASVKLCGFGMFNPNWNAESIRFFFDHCVDLFGYERMLFGSNFPVDKLMRPYKDIVSDMLLLTSEASDEQRAQFFSQNASRIYRL